MHEHAFPLEYDVCLDGPCTSWKTTCNATGSGQSQYPYICTCNKGFTHVGTVPGLENQELCVLPEAQVPQSSGNVTCTSFCGPNANCKDVEGGKACECLQGFVGDANFTSGCAAVNPSVVLVLRGNMQIPLAFQTVLQQQYNYSYEYSQSVSQVQSLIDRVLQQVTGYILYSANVTDFNSCDFIDT